MASSPEQEIPQEIVELMRLVMLKGRIPDLEDVRRGLEAVLPDLQRPLLEEIERLKGELEARPPKWVNEQLRRLNRDFIQDCGQMKAERDAYIKELGEVNVERQRQEVRAIEAERERDARPDLKAEEIEELLALRGPDAFFAEDHAVWKSARAKLERSLDAHKP